MVYKIWQGTWRTQVSRSHKVKPDTADRHTVFKLLFDYLGSDEQKIMHVNVFNRNENVVLTCSRNRFSFPKNSALLIVFSEEIWTFPHLSTASFMMRKSGTVMEWIIFWAIFWSHAILFRLVFLLRALSLILHFIQNVQNEILRSLIVY